MKKKKEEADTAGHIKMTRSFWCQEKKRKRSWEMAFSLDRSERWLYLCEKEGQGEEDERRNETKMEGSGD